MIAYIDSSVIIRVVLHERALLDAWDDLEFGVTSELTKVECSRVVHRLRYERQRPNDAVDVKWHAFKVILDRLEIVPLDAVVLARAAAPFPRHVRTLDAIHLASAMRFHGEQPEDERPILFATHDKQLADAARAMNFEVLGA